MTTDIKQLIREVLDNGYLMSIATIDNGGAVIGGWAVPFWFSWFAVFFAGWLAWSGLRK